MIAIVLKSFSFFLSIRKVVFFLPLVLPFPWQSLSNVHLCAIINSFNLCLPLQNMWHVIGPILKLIVFNFKSDLDLFSFAIHCLWDVLNLYSFGNGFSFLHFFFFSFFTLSSDPICCWFDLWFQCQVTNQHRWVAVNISAQIPPPPPRWLIFFSFFFFFKLFCAASIVTSNAT